jgi:hypothetical protein
MSSHANRQSYQNGRHSSNGVSNGRSGGLTPISFSQNDHMKIILGKPKQPARPKKNGLLSSSSGGVGHNGSSGDSGASKPAGSGYNFKAVSGLKNLAGGLWGNRLKSHQNGLGLNKKETPL